jgi:uncharacterized membrane protein YeiH
MILLMSYTNFREGVMGSDHARFIGVGIIILIIIAALTGGGYVLDALLGTLPLFLLLGVFSGFAASLYYVYLKLKDLGGS